MAESAVKTRRTEKATSPSRAAAKPAGAEASVAASVPALVQSPTPVVAPERPLSGKGAGRGRSKSKPTGPRRKSPRKTSVTDRNGDLSTIKGRITTRRVELGMDQATAAAKTGVARAAYSQYETGKVTPNIGMIEQLSETLDVRPEYIAYGIGESDDIEWLRYEPAARMWVRHAVWGLPQDWIDSRVPGIGRRSLCMVEVTNDSAVVQPGDMALVNREARPTETEVEEYMFVLGKEAVAANMRRVDANTLQIWTPDGKDSYPAKSREVNVLGKIVAHIQGADG